MGASSNPKTVAVPITLSEQLDYINMSAKELLKDPLPAKKLPGEADVLLVLSTYRRILDRISEKSPAATNKAGSKDVSSTSAMLKSIDEKQGRRQVTVAEVLHALSRNSTSILEHPYVYITTGILKTYSSLQIRLDQPHVLPDMFTLYRTKPSPRLSSTEVTFAPLKHSAASVAVPPEIATDALAAAIDKHSLHLCLSIITETFSTPSHLKAKTLRAALLPAVGATLLAPAVFTLAHQFAHMQTTMDPAQASGIYLAGMLTYLFSVGSMGYIAATTANDDMVRVTWADGAPLWERWVREDERAAVDRVAQAWGFRERHKWGDEEGGEWDELREWTGLRGMVLDRVERMQGMQ